MSKEDDLSESLDTSTECLVQESALAENCDGESPQKPAYVVGQIVRVSGTLLECVDDDVGLWSVQLEDGVMVQVREKTFLDSGEATCLFAGEVEGQKPRSRAAKMRKSVTAVAEHAWGVLGAGARGVVDRASQTLPAVSAAAGHATGYAGEQLGIMAEKATNAGEWLGSKAKRWGSSSSTTSSLVPLEPERRRMTAYTTDQETLASGGSSLPEEERGLIKSVDESGESEAPALVGERPGVGIVCRKGLHKEPANQDSWFVVRLRKDFVMYCVMDGHGVYGHSVANFVKATLPKLILEDKRLENPESELLFVCTDAFERMQNLIEIESSNGNLDASLSGSTATLVIHDLNKTDANLTVAYIGNSAVVLATRSNEGSAPCRIVGSAQTPQSREERSRIESKGGSVVFDGYANHRVFAKGKQYPGLTVARSFGDILGHKEAGIISTPEVEVFTVKQNQYILLCSDGVWEFVTEIEAESFVKVFAPENANLAAQRLAKEAWDRWIREEGGIIVDDITVILSHFDIDPEQITAQAGEGSNSQAKNLL